MHVLLAFVLWLVSNVWAFCFNFFHQRSIARLFHLKFWHLGMQLTKFVANLRHYLFMFTGGPSTNGCDDSSLWQERAERVRSCDCWEAWTNRYTYEVPQETLVGGKFDVINIVTRHAKLLLANLYIEPSKLEENMLILARDVDVALYIIDLNLPW